MNSIESNRKYFEKCIEIAQLLYRKGLYEDCARYVQKIGYFAWLHQTGFYVSKSLEDLLAKIGSTLPKYNILKKEIRRKVDKLNILHVCSEIFADGGHSRLIFKWIENDADNQHSLVSTRQNTDYLAKVSLQFGDFSSVDFFSVKSDSIIESAVRFKELLYMDFDIIILHIHPNEVIPNIVFSDKSIDVPIALLNHADHVFWFGVTILDTLIQIREVNIELDKKRRGVSKQFFLPIPIPDTGIKKNVREKDEDFLQLLTVGSSYKYTPNEEYNIFGEALYIVSKYNNVIFNFVGVDPDAEIAKEYSHDRIIYHGVLKPSELDRLIEEIDLYIEGFPVPSFTALLEPAMKGIPFLLHYNPSNLLRLFGDNEYYRIVYPRDVNVWRNQLNELITNSEYRELTSASQAEFLYENYSIGNWRNKLNEFYSTTIQLKERKDCLLTNNISFFEGRDEKALIDVHEYSINHFEFTNNFSLKDKLKVLSHYRFKVKHVERYGFNGLFKWFCNK